MKDAYFFSHDSNARNDEKILELRAEFGWEGYGLFWALIETMRDAPQYRLTLERLGGLAVGFGVTKLALQQLVERAIEIGLFSRDGEHFWSESLRRRMVAWDVTKEKLSAAGKRGAAKRWAGDGVANGEGNGHPMATPIAIREEKSREDIIPPTPLRGDAIAEPNATERERQNRTSPTAEEVIECARRPGVDAPEKYARHWHALTEAAGWKDGDGRPIKGWERYFIRSWKNEPRDWEARIDHEQRESEARSRAPARASPMPTDPEAEEAERRAREHAEKRRKTKQPT